MLPPSRVTTYRIIMPHHYNIYYTLRTPLNVHSFSKMRAFLRPQRTTGLKYARIYVGRMPASDRTPQTLHVRSTPRDGRNDHVDRPIEFLRKQKNGKKKKRHALL